MWQLWARLAFLDASTKFYYNFYLIAVVIDSTCLCLAPFGCARIRIVLDKPEDEVSLDFDDIRGFISHDVWFMIDPDLDVHDKVMQSNRSRIQGTGPRGLMRPKTSNLNNVRPDVQTLLTSPVKRNANTKQKGCRKQITWRNVV